MFVRTLLTIAGIVLGVAVFVAHAHREPGVFFAFRAHGGPHRRRRELQVTAGETGFDEEVLERVQASPSVQRGGAGH